MRSSLQDTEYDEPDARREPHDEPWLRSTITPTRGPLFFFLWLEEHVLLVR